MVATPFLSDVSHVSDPLSAELGPIWKNLASRAGVVEPTSVSVAIRLLHRSFAEILGCLVVAGCTGEIAPASPAIEGMDSAATSGGPNAATTGAAGSGGTSSATGGSSAQSTTSAGGPGGGVAVPNSESILQQFTRLTRAEYSSTVERALGVTPDVNLIPEDGRVGPFTSNYEVTPDPVHPYLLEAEELASATVPETLPPCEPERASECVSQDYGSVLTALFRRPLNDADVRGLTSVIDLVTSGGGSAEAATRAMLASALLSPDFLYRASPSGGSESASAESVLARRLAERLSFALWDAPPDDELEASALAATDSFREDLLVQAARASRDDRATPVIARFLGQWLDVDTDLRLEDPEFATSPDYLELLRFVEDAVEGDMAVTDFVGGRTGFAHRENLELYQLDAGNGGDDVTQVTWPADSPRRGLLGEELFAGSTRHPDVSRREIFRGLLVRRALLCDTIPAPNAELVALAGEVGDRTQDTRCRGCHQLMDPIGRAFVGLDPDIDEPPPAAEVLAHSELEGTYATAGELLETVAKSRAFAECFSKNWLAFFLERPRADIDDAFVSVLADRVQAGASFGDVVETTAAELYERSQTITVWCEGS